MRWPVNPSKFQTDPLPEKVACVAPFERPIYTSSSNPQRLGDFRDGLSLSVKSHRLLRLQPRGRRPSQISVLRFGLGDPLLLTLKHHVTLELGESGEDRQNQLSSGGLGIDHFAAEVENAKASTPRPQWPLIA